MGNHEALKFSLPVAGTSAVQTLTLGGHYVVDSVATGTPGSVDVQKLGPDGTTWIDIVAQLTAAAGATSAVILSPGEYRVVSVTFTAVFVTIARAPLN